MIKNLTVINYLNESLSIDLADPKDGLIIKNISGIGPSSAIINTMDVPTMDGAIFNSSKKEIRNITISIGYMDTIDIEDARRLTYKFFAIKRRIELIIETNSRKASIVGYVEKNEPNIFDQNVSSSISIICPDPNFYSVIDKKNTVVFSGLVPMFSFPFSNESLTEKEIIMGDLVSKREENVYYTGDAEVGITITIHAIGKATNITIYSIYDRGIMEINTNRIKDLIGSEFSQGDDIIINTVQKEKSVTLIKEGISYNILNCLNKNPYWFTLKTGDNLFAYTAETGELNLQFKIEHLIAYDGV